MNKPPYTGLIDILNTLVDFVAYIFAIALVSLPFSILGGVSTWLYFNKLLSDNTPPIFSVQSLIGFVILSSFLTTGALFAHNTLNNK